MDQRAFLQLLNRIRANPDDRDAALALYSFVLAIALPVVALRVKLPERALEVEGRAVDLTDEVIDALKRRDETPIRNPTAYVKQALRNRLETRVTRFRRFRFIADRFMHVIVTGRRDERELAVAVRFAIRAAARTAEADVRAILLRSLSAMAEPLGEIDISTPAIRDGLRALFHVHGLTELQRTILFATLDGCTPRDIARELRRTQDAVRKQLREATTRIGSAFNQGNPGNDPKKA